MAATNEQKAADAEAKRVEKAEQEQAERERVISNAPSVADAQARAENELREQIRAELRAELTTEVTGQSVEGFSGQVKSSKNYTVLTTETLGRETVELRPAGWVGPGTIIPGSRVKEVADLLNSIESLPDQEK